MFSTFYHSFKAFTKVVQVMLSPQFRDGALNLRKMRPEVLCYFDSCQGPVSNSRSLAKLEITFRSVNPTSEPWPRGHVP